MSGFNKYLEETASDTVFIHATFNGFDIDLGKHAQNRGDSRLSISKDELLVIAQQLAKFFHKTNADGLYGFYNHDKHISGIFRFFKRDNRIKFITVFPDKKVVFMNDIKGAYLFNESKSGDVAEGIPIDEQIIGVIEI